MALAPHAKPRVNWLGGGYGVVPLLRLLPISAAGETPKGPGVALHAQMLLIKVIMSLRLVFAPQAKPPRALALR